MLRRKKEEEEERKKKKKSHDQKCACRRFHEMTAWQFPLNPLMMRAHAM